MILIRGSVTFSQGGRVRQGRMGPGISASGAGRKAGGCSISVFAERQRVTQEYLENANPVAVPALTEMFGTLTPPEEAPPFSDMVLDEFGNVWLRQFGL